MGAGLAGARAAVVCAVLSSVLGIGATAGAGTDDTGDAKRTAPVHGVTYSGKAEGLRVALTAIAPTSGGDMTVLAEVRLECGDVKGENAPRESQVITVGDDGKYAVEVHTEEEGGGERIVDIEVSGRFEKPKATTAEFSYELYNEDDDGNSESCDEDGDLDLKGGRANRGLQRTEVAIPLEPEGESRAGGLSLAATTDAVFLGLGDPPTGDSTEILRIDPATNEVAAQATVPVDVDLAAAGASLYAIDRNLGTVTPIDTTSLALGAPIQVVSPQQEGDEERALARSAAAIDGSLWIAATRDRELVRIDTATNTVAARVPLDAYPSRVIASATNLYVESQTTPAFSSGTLPETNVIRRLDPSTGAVLATSEAYRDGSIGGSEASDDGVVVDLTVPGVDDADELVLLDPETLELRETAPLQIPLVAAPPGYWTNHRSILRALGADLTRELDVPHVLSEFGPVGVGFDAVWVYNEEQQILYRVSTS